MRIRKRVERLCGRVGVGKGSRCPSCPPIALFEVGEGEEGPPPPVCARCGRDEMAIYVVRPDLAPDGEG